MIGKRFMVMAMIACAGTACRAEAPAAPPHVVATPRDPALQHHEIRADRLPPPFATPSAGNPPDVVRRPPNAALHLPPGFRIGVWASGLEGPRTMINAPNGDVIVSEPDSSNVLILRDANHDGVAETRFTFASGLDEPFGLALHGGFLYVGNTNGVVRFPYATGQTAAKGAPQKIASLPGGGHSTRGLLFNKDGTKLYVSIGSASNVDVESPPRAAITEMNPDGSGRRIFASGLRNPVGMTWEPSTHALWTAVNERDGLGDDLVPDYVTSVKEGAFYGWPWYFIGAHEDPRHAGERPDLKDKVTVPDVLMQAHSAPLQIAFYEGAMFPAEYKGGAFVTMHGSWNRAQRTGYKVVFLPFRDGKPTGEYVDFMTGFVTPAGEVWGRPVGVAVAHDGSLFISDDGSKTIWRVSRKK
jgi:glucose/arabinose dehydrogenase